MHTLTLQPSFQSYDPPSSAAISSNRPPPNGAVQGRLVQHQPRPLAHPSRKGMPVDSEIASSRVPTTRNASEAASMIVPTTSTPQISSSQGDTPMPSDATNGRSRSRVVLHQDSGIRLRRDSEEEEEMPPLYTPG